MKPKRLESELQDVGTFSHPKQNLEQYATTPALATKVLHLAAVEFGDIEDKSVIDLGVGTGVLAIGAKLMGAGHVLGLDVDMDALSECKENLEMYEPELEVELVLMDVIELIRRYDDYDEQESDESDDDDDDDDDDNNGDGKRKDYVWPKADTVVTNPPFGTRRKGADVAFLAAAMKMADTAVYSFHKTSTREYIQKVATKKLGAKSAKVVAEMKYGLKNQYGHHRKDEVEVFVDVWRIEPTCKMKRDGNNDEDEIFEQNLRDLAANIEELQLSARERKDKHRSSKNSNNTSNTSNRR